MNFPKSDTGPLGVSLEVFLARSDAFLSSFDLRRVASFTYAYNVPLKTMHALQKEVNGSNGVLPKREKNTPCSSVLIRSLDRDRITELKYVVL